MTITDQTVSARARALARAIEPFTAQVYFAPESHDGYQALGFEPSARQRDGAAAPDPAAYFTSRGALLGQVPGEVVAAAFAVFNPAVVVPLVAHGWSLTDAATIEAARTAGAVGQLERVLGRQPVGVERARDLLARAVDGLRPEGRPLFAGLLACDVPGSPLGAAWRFADRLREYRGDCHTSAWTAADLDAVEIGLLSDLYKLGKHRSFVRSRAWSADDLDAGEERLAGRGLLVDAALTDSGRAVREAVEVTTDAQCRPVVEALGDDVDELLAIVIPWSEALISAGGFPSVSPSGHAPPR